MRALLRAVVDRIQTSLWLVPACLITASIVLALLTFWVDSVLRPLNHLDWIVFGGGPDGARAVLSTIAGSMATVAGVTFSITIVALTLASSQFGPRLLRNFMRDRVNQAVLGIFLGTFVYCLLSLRATGRAEDPSFVPQLSVTVGIVLAILSLMVFVYFIHHISISIQPEWVIASVRAEFQIVCASMSCERDQHTHDPARASEADRMLARFAQEGRTVSVAQSGYVQTVDMEGILATSSDADIVVKMLCRPGDFLCEGAPLLLALPAERVTEETERVFRKAHIVGAQRTPIEDVEFAIEQLVEIALRALSPGINDPFTAITCVDYLGTQLAQLAGREFPSRFRYDHAGSLRVIADVPTFSSAADAAFNQIRQHALTHVAVLIRMFEAISNVALAAQRESDLEVLRRHTELVYAAGNAKIPESSDRSDLEEQYRKTLQLLEAGRG